MPTREYAGGAKRTTLSAAITSTSTTFSVTDGAGYPTGATGPFAIAIDVGLAGEEKVLIATRTGNAMTVAASGRGYDGTTATAHSSGTVDHVITAVDVREANAHVNDTTTGDPHPQYLTPAEGGAVYLVRSEVQSAAVATSESTTSDLYVDLATAGPSVTVTVGTSGRVRLSVGAWLTNNVVNGGTYMDFATTGANVRAALTGDSTAFFVITASGQQQSMSRETVLTGLTPGSTTFTAKYRTSPTGVAVFQHRRITVQPL